MAQARLRGENRGGSSSPARRGDRTRSALPRSPSGSTPRAWLSTLPRAAVLQILAAKTAPGPRAKIRQESLWASAGAGWLYSGARRRQAGPHPALDPFPWQRQGLRRPTAAKPRCVTSRRLLARGGARRGPCGASGGPFPHPLQLFSEKIHLPSTLIHSLFLEIQTCSKSSPFQFLPRPPPSGRPLHIVMRVCAVH